MTDDDLAASQRPGYDRGRPKLDFFLEQLAEKPSVDPLLSSAPELTANTDPLPDDMRPPSPNPSLAPPSPTLSAPREPLGSSTNQSQQNQERTNPELDSFAYIESLFESLAVLGKLPDALDAVAHRIPVEVFSLVDATVDEVDDRNIDSKKRMSTMPSSLISMLPDASAVSASIKNASADALATLAASNPRSALLRLNATQATALELSAETLRDLFWTLYSKLDAVLQGFRVGYEVCLRISEVRSFTYLDRKQANTSYAAETKLQCHSASAECNERIDKCHSVSSGDMEANSSRSSLDAARVPYRG